MLTALAVIPLDLSAENEFLSGRVDRGPFGTLERISRFQWLS
jgi:hypothetical protein